MSAIQQLLCSLGVKHQWETTEDPSGDLTVCSRCGKLRHAPGKLSPARPSPLKRLPRIGGHGRR